MLTMPASFGAASGITRNARLAAASRSMFKLTLTVIQGLHISKVYVGTGDMFAGSVGVLTSYMDCCDLWPKLKPGSKSV